MRTRRPAPSGGRQRGSEAFNPQDARGRRNRGGVEDTHTPVPFQLALSRKFPPRFSSLGAFPAPSRKLSVIYRASLNLLRRTCVAPCSTGSLSAHSRRDTQTRQACGETPQRTERALDQREALSREAKSDIQYNSLLLFPRVFV